MRTCTKRRNPGFGRRFASASVAGLITFALLLVTGGDLRAIRTTESDTISIAHYNVQFLLPSWLPAFVLEALDPPHMPNSPLRASLIGHELACYDIVSLNEVSNDERRADILQSMEANAAACGRPALIDGGTRFWDVYAGPHIAQTDPIVDDEVAIASRFPIIQVHSIEYSSCTEINCLAAKGALHARLWRGPGHHGRDALDVFVTHLNDSDDATQLAQLDELAGFIQTYHDPAIPAIIMGDLNVAGNREDLDTQGSLYKQMMQKLQNVLPALEDTGDPGPDIPTNPTNARQSSRIDYVLMAGLDAQIAEVDYYINKFFDISDPDLPQDGRLSDHGAVLTKAEWEVRSFPPNPSTNLPREVRVEVSRLQEITADVPAFLPGPGAPFVIVMPIGPPLTFFVPVVGACDGLTDHFGDLQLAAGGAVHVNNIGEGSAIEGDDITPGWGANVSIGPGPGNGSVDFALFDDDDFFCGDFNDEQDINPFTEDFGITLTLDFAADGIFFGTTQLARIGEPLFLQGTDEDNRARATLFIETRYSSTHDSDGDGLVDADEAYVHGTNPEDSDTDDDQLTDGEEVLTYHTNPLDPDTDDDLLNDGLEVAYGTDPLEADTDGDGLLDGQDVEFIANAIQALPASSFQPPGEGTRTAILLLLDAVEMKLIDGDLEKALALLASIRKRVDGCGTSADGNDWIRVCPDQIAIRTLVDLLTANLGG